MATKSKKTAKFAAITRPLVGDHVTMTFASEGETCQVEGTLTAADELGGQLFWTVTLADHRTVEGCEAYGDSVAL